MSERPGIFFTGASGRVGSRVIPILKNNHSIVPVDVVEPSGAGGEFVKIDLTNRNEVLEGFRGAGAIVHSAIASLSVPDTQLSEPERLEYNERMFEVNMRATYHVFEAAQVHRIRRVVFISSLTASLGADHGHKYCPGKMPSPVNFYACTKIFGENLAEVYHRLHGVEVLILRLGQPFPMGLPMEKVWAADPFASSIFVTFPDIARAVDAALTSPVKFGRYNVVSLHPEPTVTVEAGKEIGFYPQDIWDPHSSGFVSALAPPDGIFS